MAFTPELDQSNNRLSYIRNKESILKYESPIVQSNRIDTDGDFPNQLSSAKSYR